MGAGVDAASRAINAKLDPYNRLLSAESLRTSTPLSVLQNFAGIAVPIAQLGQQSTGTTTKDMSGAEQFNLLAKSLQALFGGGGGVGSSSSF